jgi:hypothetical protein
MRRQGRRNEEMDGMSGAAARIGLTSLPPSPAAQEPTQDHSPRLCGSCPWSTRRLNELVSVMARLSH